ncbi:MULTISPECIES: sugar porter family MFS transporter [unclassified Streptomyces]|uniref:sugar porter family MFS transporter n=1 Tax=unclassified Streptomyces TaxID=2593676 RepID=UPI0022572DE7|nr:MULTISPECIES: sugar porter family MFS transporter [unclassified Streptomyces]WSP57786.1 sugar porter family MFS transporter [Streptomyces sp. NBC_01241]WSU21478.1 sugar porter family MFS transporter [Streptomyces sp. NBC_01108]MCX4789667.1 sugar porter family MFS transporter [Streptomyces sp. NBC_01221]MCX4794606.1 sugar porter family MFS transporter [Streptomyces sp. NBC_01242]WSP62390.1 sugar porter family MFS transporter [Streptomyces sp. NBC_01240]
MTSTAQGPASGARGARPDHLGHVIFITAAAAMGGFLFGYDSSVINGAVEAIRSRYGIGSATLAQVIAIALIGCAIGAATAGRIADRIGRIRCMQIASVLFTISALGSALPFALWDLAMWRIIGGFAIGMASVIGPAYIAEVSPPAYRGRLGSFQQAAIVIGIAISQLVNYGILQLADGDQRGRIGGIEAWQWMLGVMVVPAVLYGLLSLAIPESPRFLISVGKKDRARKILAEVEGKGVDLDARVTEIETAMHREHKSRFTDLLGSRFGFLPVVWVGIGLSVFQQLVGINVAFYYSATLWQSVGVDPSASFLYSFTTSIINIIGTVIAMVLVDRVGRKPLALVGSTGMAIALAFEAWAFSAPLVGGKLPHTQGIVALVAAHVFVLFFALSWGVIVWVFLGEMFPNKIRAAALGVAASAQWIANWAITASFPSLADWNLSGTYIIYACFATLSIPFVLKFVKETKGKALEEMG